MARTKKVREGGKWQAYNTDAPDCSSGSELGDMSDHSDSGSDLGDMSDLESEIDSSSRHAADPVSNEMGMDAEVAGTASTRDLDRWGPEAAAFIRSDSGIGEEWVGHRPLGKGGFGLAGLWVKKDEDGRGVAVFHTLSSQCGA